VLETGDGYVVFVTEKGQIKKTPLEEFANIRSSGILAIKLSADDYLISVGFSTGEDDILITTSHGQSIRFSEKDVRAMGRAASGVTGIRLAKSGDQVVGTIIVPKGAKDLDLLVVTQKGFGKRTPISEYKTQGRGGSGILTYKVTEKTGKLVNAREQRHKINNDLLIATSSGKIIRLTSKQVPTLGRATVGVRLIRLEGSDSVTSVANLEEEAALAVVTEA
jgi:DNA gyrase subunit A